MISEVAALPVEEQGALLGLAAAGLGAAAAERLGGPPGRRCRTALEALAGLSQEARAAELAELGRRVGAAVPDGLEQVHPGWLRRALEEESPRVLAAVTPGLPAEVTRVADELLQGWGGGRTPRSPAAGAAVALLRRLLFADLAPMPTAATSSAMPVAAALCALTAAALGEEIERRGATVLGVALQGAAGDVVARAASAVGEPLARAVLAATREARTPAARAEARALVAAVPPQEAARGVTWAVGVRAVARSLAAEGRGALRAVAQRLPPRRGEALLAGADAAANPADVS